MFLTGNALKERRAAVQKRTPRAIPIHRKPEDAHVAGTLDLLAQNVWILSAIADVDVVGIPKPRLIVGDNLRIAGRGGNILQRQVPSIRMIASL